MNPKFSVLISLYNGETASCFNMAMESIWLDQTLQPNEIVLMVDGQIRKELGVLVDKWKGEVRYLKVIYLDRNMGLGEALRRGMIHCSYEIVARMDTDDISVPDRFERQVKILADNKNIDVVGSWIAEFSEDPSLIDAYRKLPEEHKKLRTLSKWRDPVNHMTVMFKKQSVLNAGNYQSMLWFEDTWLWARMMMGGCVFYNIQNSLVLVRAGQNMHGRRRGLKYLFAEARLIRNLYRIDFLNSFEAVINLLIRAPIRILPAKMLGYVFSWFLRDKNKLG